MKKIICSILALFFVSSVCFAGGWQEKIYRGWDIGGWGKNNIALKQLRQIPGLTFYKDFRRGGNAFANFAMGSFTGTYTCARSATAPATYVDNNGIIRKTITSDVPRYSGGYYDATGFHQANLGYFAERASTNLLVRTDGTAYADGLWTGWETGLSTKTGTIVTTNTAIPELTSIVGATSQRLQYTGIATDTNKTIIINPTTSTGVGTAANGDVFTDSVYIRSINGLTGVTSVKLNVRAYNAAGAYLGIRVGPDILASITSGWSKFSFAGTLIDATASQVRFDLTVAGVDENDTVDIEIALPQIEKLPYATSFIPTTTAALTRAADVLKYENGNYINATRSASNPATYIDGSGVIQLVTTSNIPRVNSGYYDTTGFHAQAGRIATEAAGTNLLSRTDGTAYGSGLWTGWAVSANGFGGTPTYTNVAIPELTGIAGAASQRVQYTGTGDANKSMYPNPPMPAYGTASPGDVFTATWYMRSQSGNTGITVEVFLDIRNAANSQIDTRFSSDLSGSITTSWRKFTLTGTMPANTDHVNTALKIGGIDTGDAVDIEFYGVQLEKSATATSFIPTTTTALTRNAETVNTSVNSTPTEETIFIKFTPESTFANDGKQKTLYDTSTKRRIIYKQGNETKVKCYVNLSDSGSVNKSTTTIPSGNTYGVYAVVLKHSDPYINVYYNGVSEATYTAGDWTDPAWGDYWFVGSDIASGEQFDGHISAVVKYGRALNSVEISQVTSILQ